MDYYKNKDFIIWKNLAKSQKDWAELFLFLHPTFNKFCGLTEEEMLYKYGIINSDVRLYLFTKETGVMVGHYGTSYTFIIPKENIEFAEYFENNAPMKFFERKKQIRGLWSFALHRDNVNENIENQIKPYEVDYDYRLKFKKFYDSYNIDIT
jgi:hypothetical protein